MGVSDLQAEASDLQVLACHLLTQYVAHVSMKSVNYIACANKITSMSKVESEANPCVRVIAIQ